MTRYVGWCGQKYRQVPYLDPETTQPVLRGDGQPVMEMDLAHEVMRDVVVSGFTTKVLPRRAGFSREYVFGPSHEAMVQAMEDDDAALLFASPEAINFLDVTNDQDRYQFLRPTDELLVEGLIDPATGEPVPATR